MSTKVETIHTVSHRKVQSALAALAIHLVLPLAGAAVVSTPGNGSSGEVVTEDLSAPLGNGTSAAIILQRYSGDMTINVLNGNEPLLAIGKLPYLDNQNLTRDVDTSSSQAVLT